MSVPLDPSQILSVDNGRDWLAFGVALYGAVVATAVAAYQLIRDRPGVSIVLNQAGRMLDDNRHWHVWSIRIVNHRKRPITIMSAGLLLETNSRGQLNRLHPSVVDENGNRADRPLPATLSDGMSVEFYVPREGWSVVHKGLTRRVCGAWATDALNHTFEMRYPSRNPRGRWQAWRQRRSFERYLREEQEHKALRVSADRA
jgi:hypothetical protein